MFSVSTLIAQAAMAASLTHPHPTPPAHAIQADRPTDAVQIRLMAQSAHEQKSVKTSRYYVVRQGDTLSKIATKHKVPGGWLSIYAANHKKIANPDVILPGQRLILPSHSMTIALPRRTDYVPRHAKPVTATVVQSSYQAPVSAPVSPSTQTAAQVNPSSYSGFQACVIARESGGNSQVMNSSGHYGLYQFSESTWEAYGGSAADFGHASVSEQNRVFGNAMAQGGQSNWSPYDGC